MTTFEIIWEWCQWGVMIYLWWRTIDIKWTLERFAKKVWTIFDAWDPENKI